MTINNYIDHTLLKPSATLKEIETLCDEAKKYNFFSVCINGFYVPLAKELLAKSNVKICSVVGFPLGAMTTETKVFEAQQAISDGADEIDMVINIGMLKSKNFVKVYTDIRDVKIAIGTNTLKVILEISELSKNEIVKACQICLDAKADYIKTSTGFSKSGATLTAVKMIKKTVKDGAKIKASGGIRTLETAKKYIDAGVDRIGASAGVSMMVNKELKL
ncbi:deoxyribose-phosphate aldolase [Bizionia argentinensis JUB59]|uniref:Deoxyribose-phosphate aldolase n=1 Tax=Bizionia argentinensis JUB59 TaxID=1046627 RepID=G2EGS0_9FLAO|nr:deoxyribose-phosphate aldolase [Bizionia argentinensis]EGV42379.1 deoxyribose-phosphate aldolase [Bizionia argentinensis JUB59]